MASYDKYAAKTVDKCLFDICKQESRNFNENSPLIIYLKTKGHLNDFEVDTIFAASVPVGQLNILVKILKSKMTTQVFKDFVFSIGDTHIGNNRQLSNQLLSTYEEIGHDLWVKWFLQVTII